MAKQLLTLLLLIPVAGLGLAVVSGILRMLYWRIGDVIAGGRWVLAQGKEGLARAAASLRRWALR